MSYNRGPESLPQKILMDLVTGVMNGLMGLAMMFETAQEFRAHRAEVRAHRNRGGEYPLIDKPMTWQQKRLWDRQ